MARVKGGTASINRHKKVLRLAKGYVGRSNSCFRIALQRLEKALRYAYRDRRNKKRDFRGLWIQRINAGARLHGLTYSKMIGGLHRVPISGLSVASALPATSRLGRKSIYFNDPGILRSGTNIVRTCGESVRE